MRTPVFNRIGALCGLMLGLTTPLISCHAQGKTMMTATETTFGDAHFRLPAGWQHQEHNSSGAKSLILMPPGLKADQQYLVLLLPGRDLKGNDFRQVFEALLKASLTEGERLTQASATQASKSNGYDLLVRAAVVTDAAGKQTTRLYAAANPNGRFESLIVIADSEATLKQRDDDFKQLMSSFRFGNTAGHSGAKGTEPAPEAKRTLAEGAAGGIPTGKGTPIAQGYWLNIGPNTRSLDGRNTGGTFVRDLALDMTDHALYVAARSVGDFEPNGGLFVSHDEGKTWKTLYGFNCDQIVPTGSDRLYALQSEQIIRSDDRGKSWVKCARPRYHEIIAGDAEIQCIAASPANPDTLYAGANGVHGAGLYRSLDGGRTWTRPAKNHIDGMYHALFVDPGRADILYGLIGGFLLQSNDGGAHFYSCLDSGKGGGPATRDPLPIKVVKPGIAQIDPAFPQFGYICHGSTLYRTGDGGQHWTKLLVPGAQFVNSIASQPGSPQVVYVMSGMGISVSQDAGRTWTALKSADAPKSAGGFTVPSVFTGTAFNAVVTVVHEDEPILLMPQQPRLYYGTAGGIRLLIGAK